MSPEARVNALGEAAAAVTAAAQEIRAKAHSDPAAAQVAATAAADLLTTVAYALEGEDGGPISRAADAFDRAARDLYGRVVAATRRSYEMRAVARLVALLGRIAPGRKDELAALQLVMQMARLGESLDVLPVGRRLLRGVPGHRRARGLLAHLDAPSAPKASSLVRVRHHRGHNRPPLLLPQQIQAMFAHPALVAACHDGHWWELDQWYPRCDPRIPLSDREPLGHIGSNPGLIGLPWLREAAKWCLGTMLDAATLRWSTVGQGRMASLQRFDRWLTNTFTDSREVLGDPAGAPAQAAAFRRWASKSTDFMAPHTRISHLSPSE